MKKGLVITLVVFFIIVLLLQLLSIGLKIAEFVNPNEVLREEIAIQNGKIAALQDTIRQISENISIEEELRITKEEIAIQNGKIAVLQDTIRQVSGNISITIQQEIDTFISQYHLVESFCNISSFNWRRVVYINMTDPEAECPSGLNEVSNSNTGQRACGRSVDAGCSSVTFPVNTTYSQVCGIARGYQYGAMEAFQEYEEVVAGETVDQTYVDGLSITRGSPRQHLWTLAVGGNEYFALRQACPRDQDPYYFLTVNAFVGDHFYCETGFTTYTSGVTAWSDPLWDGAGCIADTAHSCDRYGWFHREIGPTQDDIEVRWCSDQGRGNEDVYTDLLEIWVL